MQFRCSNRSKIIPAFTIAIILAYSLITKFNCHAEAATLTALNLTNPPLKKGVGYNNPMTWGSVSPDHSDYRWFPYSDQKYAIDTELIQKVQNAGFDHIRLPVDPGPFLKATPERRHLLDTLLLSNINKIRNAGLDVIVDIHPITMIPAYNCTSLLGDGMFPSYIELAKTIARLIVNIDPAHVALEPFNEPCLQPNEAGDRNWDAKMHQLHNAIREVAPDLLIIISGNRWGQHTGMITIDPRSYGNSNVRFTFHYYNPFEFTHQGLPLDKSYPLPRSLTNGIRYPATSDQFTSFMEIFSRRVAQSPLDDDKKSKLMDSGKTYLLAYFNGAGSKNGIQKDFDQVNHWAKINGVLPNQIYVGEFGVVSKVIDSCADGNPLPTDRLEWLKDVRDITETSGFGWSYWELTKDCIGMQLTMNTDHNQLDAAVLKSLGLSVLKTNNDNTPSKSPK